MLGFLGLTFNPIISQTSFRVGLSNTTNVIFDYQSSVSQSTGIEMSLNIPVANKFAISIAGFGQYGAKGTFGRNEFYYGLNPEFRIFSSSNKAGFYVGLGGEVKFGNSMFNGYYDPYCPNCYYDIAPYYYVNRNITHWGASAMISAGWEITLKNDKSINPFIKTGVGSYNDSRYLTTRLGIMFQL